MATFTVRQKTETSAQNSPRQALNANTPASTCYKLLKYVVGWFKHIVPNLLSIQRLRRFSEIGREIWDTCSMSPCQAVDECFLRGGRRAIFGSFEEIQNFRRIKKKSTAGQGLIEHVRQISRSILSTKKGVDIWTFVRKT